MLIRSQDKKRIVNIDCVDAITSTFMDTGYFIMAFNGDAETVLGFYKTEEKAIEVLDKIQESYEANKGYYLSRNKGKTSCIFQMPRDEEV